MDTKEISYNTAIMMEKIIENNIDYTIRQIVSNYYSLPKEDIEKYVDDILFYFSVLNPLKLAMLTCETKTNVDLNNNKSMFEKLENMYYYAGDHEKEKIYLEEKNSVLERLKKFKEETLVQIPNDLAQELIKIKKSVELEILKNERKSTKVQGD